MHVWIVSAVPMYCGSDSSVTQAENWAESATTVAPQIAATVRRTAGLRVEEETDREAAGAGDRHRPRR